MFGGHGVYVGGLFVAIIADDVLFLRADERSVGRFEALGLAPFEFATKDGRRQAMSYRRAPDDALESPAAMTPWLAGALDAALRAAAAKKPVPRLRPRKPR
jgi:DNA transformation protein